VADWFASTSVAAPTRSPRARPRPKPAPKRTAKPGARGNARRRPARARGPILWIVVSAVVLVGVVFVNLAVLRLNLRIDGASQERSRLRSENAELQSQLSSSLASQRIQSLARRQYGLVQADPAAIAYIDLRR
jgi:cell division protein FtsL